jgi:hypothetical protein
LHHDQLGLKRRTQRASNGFRQIPSQCLQAVTGVQP